MQRDGIYLVPWGTFIRISRVVNTSFIGLAIIEAPHPFLICCIQVCQ
jgi:hypothetical protein